MGQNYEVELWVNDSRGVTRTETITGGLTLSFDTTGVSGGLGQYTIGTFTADGTGQPAITISTTGAVSQLNALEILDVPAAGVPEPSSFVLAGLGVSLAGLVSRRRGAR